MIQLHEKSGSFFVELPHAEETRLRDAGWKESANGKRLYTQDPEALAEHADLFSPELQALFGAFVRVPSNISDEEWRAHIPPGEELFPHQRTTVEFALGTGGGSATIVGDPPGGGKTAINVALANFLRPQTWLIVCPASVKFNWRVEIERWSTRDYDLIEVIDNKTKKDHVNAIRDCLHAGGRVVAIINYDILKNFRDLLKKDIAKWDMITFDESHKLKNPRAKRTKFCLGGGNAHPLRADEYFFTSATKLNRPIDLWPVVKFCEPTRLGADREAFIERYCGGEFNPFTGRLDDKGASNVDELGYLLGQSCFIRHDIDHLLPPFREETIFLPQSEIVRSAEQELFAELLSDIDPTIKTKAVKALVDAKYRMWERMRELNLQGEKFSDDERVRVFGETFVEQAELLSSIPVVFQMLSEIRKITGQAKIPHIIQHVEDLLDRDETDPLVVMVHHKEVVNGLAEHFEGRCTKVVGGISAAKRHDAVKAFQAGEVPLFIGNIMAAGEGLTLTHSCRLVFGEIDWNGTSMWQALKRVHRITQSREVTIQYLLLQQSLDANIATRYIGKRETINEFFAGAELARQERTDA